MITINSLLRFADHLITNAKCESETEFYWCIMWTKYAISVTTGQAIYIHILVSEGPNFSSSTRMGTSLKISTSLSKQTAHPSPNHSCYTNRVHNHSPRHKLKSTLLLHIPFQKLQGLSYVYHMNIVYLPVTMGLE